MQKWALFPGALPHVQNSFQGRCFVKDQTLHRAPRKARIVN